MADQKKSVENSEDIHKQQDADIAESTAAGGPTDPPPEESNQSVKELKDEIEKLKSESLYLRAEFDNFRKQSIRERSQLVKYGAERLIVSLLDVLDNFDRALDIEVTPDNLESFSQGVRMTAKEMSTTLENFGVRSVEPKGAFDPSLHEAVSSEETTEIEPGNIVRVFKKAYKLHDKIIRPAQVVVATKPATSSEKPSN